MTDPVLFGPTPAPGLHVMSVNIRRRMRSMMPADRWTRRAPALADLLCSEEPALIGMQEALPDQAAYLRDELGPAYRMVGRGRETGSRGEGCPLFFDTRRLELLDWDQQALSDRPDTPGSVSWGNRIPRVMVSATLRDRATSAVLLMINTHLDHLSAPSRLRAARAVRERVSAAHLPAVVTGDMNAGERSVAIRELLADGVLRDSWTAAAERTTPEWGTFPAYRAPRRRRKRIDWIMVTPDVEVVRAGINTRQPRGRWVSDHLPVQAVIIPRAGAIPHGEDGQA